MFYLRLLFARAAHDAYRLVVARSIPEAIVKLIVAALIIVILYFGIEQIDPSNDAYDDQLVMIHVIFLASIVAVLLVFTVNVLFFAPYQLWKDQKGRAEQAEALVAPGGETTEQRSSRLLEEERAKQRASNQAKAEMMALRLGTRRHSYGPGPGHDVSTDAYLAALWDAETQGKMYDAYHRSTFEPMGRHAAAKAKKDRADRLFEEEMARERANVAAKAELMRNRHSARNMSMLGLTDDHLAAMWDDEQNGVPLDRFGSRISPREG